MNGQDVPEIREKLRFTQEQLAREVGVHQDTVARWERNELTIRESTARGYSRLLWRRPGAWSKTWLALSGREILG